MKAEPSPPIAYILRSYPRLSQTFILNEILALERLGVQLQIFAITPSGEPLVQEAVRDVRAPVEFLEQANGRPLRTMILEHVRLALSAPLRYVATLAFVLRRADLDTGYRTCSRFTCFLYAARLASVWRGLGTVNRPAHVHAHFAHDPTLIALLVKRLTGMGYSFTAHARDLYQVPVTALAERIREATSVVTCCAANADYLQSVAPRAGNKIRLIHHGVDVEAFQPSPAGRRSAETPLIVAVGRLVPKKGFEDLFQACRLLKEGGHAFRCEIYGDGPLREELLDTVGRLGLSGEVSLPGARTHRELLAAYRQANLFALTPYVTVDEDRDGIPNTLVEAMACALPVVATTVGGIPELVIHGQTGFLAEPRNVRTIACHLATLLSNEPLRRRLGQRGRDTVRRDFDAGSGARELAGMFAGIRQGEP